MFGTYLSAYHLKPKKKEDIEECEGSNVWLQQSFDRDCFTGYALRKQIHLQRFIYFYLLMFNSLNYSAYIGNLNSNWREKKKEEFVGWLFFAGCVNKYIHGKKR